MVDPSEHVVEQLDVPVGGSARRAATGRGAQDHQVAVLACGHRALLRHTFSRFPPGDTVAWGPRARRTIGPGLLLRGSRDSPSARAVGACVGSSSGLGNGRDVSEVDTKTLQAPAHPNVFAIDDAADLATSKTGSLAQFEGEVVVHNIRRFLAGEPPDAYDDGHGTALIETGLHKAMLLDSNDTTQPLPRARHPGARLAHAHAWEGQRRRHRRGAFLAEHARVTVVLRHG